MAGSYKLNYRLSKEKQTDLFIKFAQTLASLRSAEEVAHFLKDLLSEGEVQMLAKRLRIAELLIDGLTYEQIISDIKVAPTTIARVQTWLELYGEGYRTAINRTNKHKSNDNDHTKPFTQLKRKYPMYFWPQLLLEEIVRSASTREKQRLLRVVEQMKEKSKLSKELLQLLR